jgi:hypothetical protein
MPVFHKLESVEHHGGQVVLGELFPYLTGVTTKGGQSSTKGGPLPPVISIIFGGPSLIKLGHPEEGVIGKQGEVPFILLRVPHHPGLKLFPFPAVFGYEDIPGSHPIFTRKAGHHSVTPVL